MAGGMVLAPLAIGLGTSAASAAPGNSQRCKKPYHKNGTPKKHCFPGADTTNPQKGQNVTVSGDGQLPFSNVDVVLHSTPFALGSTTADADGAFSLTGTIPCDTAAGDHTISVAGTDDGGSAVTDSIAIVVQNASASNCAAVLGTTVTPSSSSSGTAATETARGTTSSNLPFTGSAATVMLLTLAAGLIGAGSLAVVAARRRRSTTTTV
jgi:hypothetical protein